MRIVIELKKDANPKITLNRLYKHTQLQDNYSMIMIALVDGQPRLLNLYEILNEYLKHQKDVVTRRTTLRPWQGRSKGSHPRRI